MEAIDVGRLIGQFVMGLFIGVIFTFIARAIPAARRRPALPYWVGAAASILTGLIVINRSLDTVVTAALAACLILLRHYLTLKPDRVK